jgi:hypothetical protein
VIALHLRSRMSALTILVCAATVLILAVGTPAARSAT